MKLSQRIIREWSSHKTRFTVLTVITFVSAILRTSIPYFYKLIVDLLENRAPLNEMSILISAIIFLSVSRFIVYTYFQSNRAMMNMKFQWEIRKRAFANLMKAGKLKFQHLNVGEVVTRLSDDAEKMSWFLSSGIFRGFDAILIFLFTVFFLLMMSPLLTLITVSVLTLMVAFMFAFDALFKKAFDLLQRSISRTNDYVHSTMSGISIIKSYNREEKVAEYFERIIRDRKKDELRVVRLDVGSRAFYMTLHMLSTVTVLAAGGMMKINGTITLGTLVAFLALVKNIINPVLDIGNLFVRGKSASVSNRRICELEDVGTDHHADGNADATFLYSVSLDAAGFSFQGTRILRDISMEIKKGDKVAIMGKIGSGKSFLSMMLSGVITPTSGRMVIDGLDSSAIRRSTYRKMTGYASQTPVVFSDSIRNNIIMGAEYDEADFTMAVSVSQLDKEMEKFNLGPDTLIGPKGKTLSGGQKQRLALARALYRKPELLILDDITSALDAETEMSLWDELFEKMPDQTLVLVTHRPYTAKTADMIYVMQEGSVAESGTHDDLMAYNSLYRMIYDSGSSES